MEFERAEATELLSRTPRVLRSLLGHLPSGWQTSGPSSTSWSPTDVVGHLIHAEETDWIPRVRVLLAEGSERRFPPFDQYGHVEKFFRVPLNDLLDLFDERRADSLRALKQLVKSDADLARTGIHPEFGEVTLGQHLATWVVHDLNHMKQIVRAMAIRYEKDVGPWRQYLSILRA